jgi:chaperonin GroES
MAVKVTPLGDRVLVKRLEPKQTTKGGIVLPDTAQEKPKEGEVIAVGEGKLNDKGERVALAVKAGNKVIFTSYAGTEIKIEGEEYLIMREDDILGIINE